MNALLGAFGVAESLRHEPIVISQLIRVACLQISFIATEHAINRVALSPSSLDRLQATVDAIDCDGPMTLALVGERCFLYSGLKRYGFAVIDSETGAFGGWEPLMKVPGIGLYLDWELLHIVEALDELIAVGESEPVHRRELGEQVENRLEGNQGVGYFLANILIPSLPRIYEAENRASAYLSALSSNLAALRFQNDHERMPNDLQELVPEYLSEVPTDPFSGDPLRMRSDETGFVVYSLGHDRDDDGGNPPPDGEKITTNGDIVFRIIR